jgi:hypothetical protein
MEEKPQGVKSSHGLKEFVEYLDANRERLIGAPIHISYEKTEIPVEIALQYNNSFSENVHSYVNNINTIEGGTHLAGFRRGLTRTLKKYAEDSGAASKLKFDINGDDFREGLTAIISVKVQEPQFEGQTKTKLGNTEAGCCRPAVSTMISNDQKTEMNTYEDTCATARHAAKPENWYSARLCFPARAFRVNLPIVPTAILKNVNYSWWKAILQAERQNRAVTAGFRLFCLSGVRYSMLKRQWSTGYMKVKRLKISLLPWA